MAISLEATHSVKMSLEVQHALDENSGMSPITEN